MAFLNGIRYLVEIKKYTVIAGASLVLAVWVLAACAGCAAGTAANRAGIVGPSPQAGSGAEPAQVSEGLYRSGQPSALGLRNLKAMGIKTIVNLRSFHSDCAEIGGLGLEYEQICMKPWHPEEEDAVRFLKIVTDPKRTPVLVHCKHGADRTGAMVAVYRIAVQGWSREEAILEMTQGGFGFHPIWSNLPAWIQRLDFDRIKRKAGIQSIT